MPENTKTGYYLLLTGLLHSCLILLLTGINPNHYTTVDSQYYLTSAHNLLAGNGYVIRKEHVYQWNGTFPAGYPAAIALMALLTKTNVLWASKLVNIGASAIWLFFLHQWFGSRKAAIVSCMLLLGSFLKLWAHTWSEPLFLVILSGWVYHFHQFNHTSGLQKRRFVYLLILGFLLITVRYAGIFIIPLALFCALFRIYKEDYDKGFPTALLAILWFLGFAGYLCFNHYQSGEWYGGSRFEGGSLVLDNLIAFYKGLLNEMLLIRNTDFQSADILFLSGFILQSIIAWLAVKQISGKFVLSAWAQTGLTTAFFYLAFLFTIRIFSHFDEPGYRLLSPFTFLAGCSVLHSIPVDTVAVRLKNLFIALVVLSWLEVVPVIDLSQKTNKLISMILGHLL